MKSDAENQFIRYLSTLLDTYSVLLIQSDASQALANRINSLGIKKYIPMPTQKPKNLDKPKVTEAALIAAGIALVLSAAVTIFIDRPRQKMAGDIVFVTYGSWSSAIFVGLIVGVVIGGITFPIAYWVASRYYQSKAKQEYSRQLALHQNRVDQDNVRVMREKELKDQLINEHKQLSDMYNQTLADFNHLRSFDLIYRKYIDDNSQYLRFNVAAISSFLEYFDSGRVNCLQGPHGAYNLYESELSQKRIIQGIDNINRNLTKIQYNQRMMYNIMVDTNRKIDQLNQSLNKVNESIMRLDTSVQIQTNLQNYHDMIRSIQQSHANRMLEYATGYPSTPII